MKRLGLLLALVLAGVGGYLAGRAPDVEGCARLVTEGWEAEMPFPVREEARVAFRAMAQEACEGLARDGVVRK